MRSIYLVIGVPLVLYGLVLAIRQAAFERRSQRSKGQLLEWKLVRSKWRARGSWRPEIQFEAADGSIHRFLGAIGTQPKPKELPGHVFPVLYDPRSPNQACIDTFFQRWGPALLVTLAGALCMSGNLGGGRVR